MKKILPALIIAFISIVFVMLAGGIIVKVEKAKNSAEKVKTLPSFNLVTLEGNIFNSNEVEKGPLLIVYFHPECEHCQYEISSLFENDLQSKAVKVLFVSNARPDSIRRFMKPFDINSENIHILTDTSAVFTEMFGIHVVPVIILYDENLKLVKYFKGEVRTDAILNYLSSGT
ncbi:MAG TPA: redoxin domain-containing protein [Bacteroidales bacterium]|jgi:peroxiredoxin|nr:redoxin domain-containing protein [Bacteroidales bacterium]